MCTRNSEHFKATGDVASANKFQQMLEHTKKGKSKYFFFGKQQ